MRDLELKDKSTNQDRREFTIGEVSEECDVEQHVLRYWEKQFDHLQDVTRRNGRRYYTAEDIQFIKSVKSLLYDQGLRISGAKKQLNEAGTKAASQDTLDIDQKVNAAIQELRRAKTLLNED